jgi:(p)ppGpp synthase/HD superfamily hydrolase
VSKESRIRRALARMCELHQGQKRKGSGALYITHTLAVAALVGEYGGDENQFIAALLHDAAEDAGGHATLALIAGEFGAQVAAYVRCCSDTLETPKPPWRERKEEFIAAAAGFPAEAKLIIAADKLHNARSILRDLRESGRDVWELFQGGRAGSLWYYEAVTEALGRNWEHPLLEELRRTIAAMRSFDAALGS